MKTDKQDKNRNLYEVIVPFGTGHNDMAEDGLFDDCPLCQQMRKDIEAGIVRKASTPTPKEKDK